jgi:hypothetical protein
MAQPTDPRYAGWLGGRLIPVLTGVAASGLLLVAGILDPGNILGFLILVGGGAIIGLVVGNPGNEALVLAGTLVPGSLVAAFEPHHLCVGRVGPILILMLVAGIGLLLIGLISGMRVGRQTRIGPAPQPVAAGILAAAALGAVAGWLALGLNLASVLTC